MKIYAGKKQNISIDDFIGQDVWIKCHLMKDYYVRPIRKLVGSDRITQGSVVWDIIVNLCPVSYTEFDDTYSSMSDFLMNIFEDDWIKNDRTMASKRIKILSPLEILTTQDLYDAVGYTR